jgi:hypothetical protein
MWMVIGRQRDQWCVASAMIAAIYNSQRIKDPLSPARFNPFLQQAAKHAPKLKDVRLLARMFGCVPGDEQKQDLN